MTLTPVVGSSGGTATLTANGSRLILNGVTVWGMPGATWNDGGSGGAGGTGFGSNQYANRVAIAATLASWGVKCVRFGIDYNDYVAGSGGASGLSESTYVTWVYNWFTAITGAGMYFMPCDWSSLDDGSGWTSVNTSMHVAIQTAIGNSQYLIWEPYNEPNNISWTQWQSNMESVISALRTAGFTGLIVCDPINWANSGQNGGSAGAGYSATYYGNIVTYDAGLLSGTAQIAFAKHDYANEYTSSTWNDADWQAATGNNASFLYFETELGNYNGAGTTNTTWSANAFQDLCVDKPTSMLNFAGTIAFVFGKWSDANALTAGSGTWGDNATPSSPWGANVKADLAAASGEGYTFPTTPILADFTTLSSQSPLSDGGKFVLGYPGTDQAETNGSEALWSGAASWSAWTATTATVPTTEVYAAIAAVPSSAYLGLYWISEPTFGTTATNGYILLVTVSEWQLYRMDAGVYTELGSGSVSWATGDSVGISIGPGGLINVERQPSGGAWGSLGTATDATYTGAGYVGFMFDDSAGAISSFGGGQSGAPSPVNPPVIEGAPTVATGTANSITTTTATLNGTVDPVGQATNYYFDYGTTTGYGTSVGPFSAGAGATNIPESANITGLVANTTYHFRIRATNAAGTTNGGDATFTTTATAAPAVATGTASNLQPTTVTLHGTVNPEGAATNAYFDYGTTTSYGTTIGPITVGSGTSAVSELANLTGLSPNTTYHFRIRATNGTGTTNGSDATFTTASYVAPTVATGAATGITATGATLNGTVTANGQSTTVIFNWGTTTSYGASTAPQTFPSGTAGASVAATLTGLAAGTVYHYQMAATNAAGTTVGADMIFTAQAAAPPAPAATSPITSPFGQLIFNEFPAGS